jgi:precorrin-3B synthase
LLTPFAEPRATLVAVALERWLEATDALSALPAKFSFAVDCARSPAEPVTADIRCVAEDDGWRIELDGSASAVLTEAPAAAVAELATGFLAVSGTSSTPPQRMRELVARVGAEAIFATAGLTATGSPPQERTAPCPMVGWTGAARGYGLGAAFGELNAETLMIAADLADRYATGWLRISASRSLILIGVAAAGAPGLVAAAEQAGFIIAPTDPRLSIAACAGRPACASAFTPTRVDAEHLAILDSNWIREGVHLSGCTKGCAHPIAAAITLVGSADGYDVVAHGRAGDLPLQRGLSLAQAVRFLDERHAASS